MFVLVPHGRWDKTITITGPDGLEVYVDYDDVNHDEVDMAVQKMLAILNAYWGRPR